MYIFINSLQIIAIRSSNVCVLLFSLVSFVTTILKNIMPEISILLYYPLILPFQEKSAGFFFIIFLFHFIFQSNRLRSSSTTENVESRGKQMLRQKGIFLNYHLSKQIIFFSPVLFSSPRLTHCEYIDRRLCIAVYGNAESLFSSNFQHSKQCFA